MDQNRNEIAIDLDSHRNEKKKKPCNSSFRATFYFTTASHALFFMDFSIPKKLENSVPDGASSSFNYKIYVIDLMDLVLKAALSI